jgi:hypothetical protein
MNRKVRQTIDFIDNGADHHRPVPQTSPAHLAVFSLKLHLGVEGWEPVSQPTMTTFPEKFLSFQ